MRTLSLSLLALVVCAALVSVGAAAGGDEGKGAKLVLVKKQPLVLRGLSFRPAQIIVVTVVTNGKEIARRTRSGSTGAFTATFTQLSVDPCQLEAHAVGGGRLAVYKAAERMCPPPLDPLEP